MSLSTALRPGLSALALFAATACSALPPQDFPRSDEREVVVRYELSGGEPAAIPVPASTRDLTVLWMDTEPANLRETFVGGVRRLHVDGDALVIRCRYRAYERPSHGAGPRELPVPESLFPGARSIETVWQRNEESRKLQLPAPR